MQTMPTPSAALGPLTVAGCKVYFADESVLSIRLPEILQEWRMAPSDGVQLVAVYFQETYQTWDGSQFVTLPYRHLIHGADSQTDYYWCDGASFGSGLAHDIPDQLPSGAVKTGSLLPNDAWWVIYNKAEGVRVF